MRPVAQVAAAGLLAVAVTAATASTSWASRTESGPALDAGNDGSCDTRPTTYPADGEPVPDTASCALLTDVAALVVGEVWSWADDDSVQWYSFVAATVGDLPVGGSVVMCGSTDAGHAGETYPCSPDSTYLLFTVAGVFVEWPTSLDAELYYCQLTAFGDGATAVPGRACGTVEQPRGAPPGDGEGTAETTPSASPTESPPPPEPDPSPSPTQTVTPPGDDSTAGPSAPPEPEPLDTGSDAPQTSPTVATTVAPTPGFSPSASTSVVASGSTADPLPPTTTSDAPDDPTAIDSESVARVGGSPVPMGFLLVLAGGLALGGYLMLAGPGLLSTVAAARRQRR